MLPRWRAELRIALCAERIVALRYGRGLRERIEDKRVIDVESDGKPGLPAKALAALKTLLSEPANRRAQTTLVLSSRLVRYALLPWNRTLATRAEWQAYALHTLAATYGSPSPRWELRLCAGGREAPWLACAIDADLLGAIERVEADAGVRLASLQPGLMAAFNRCRKSIGSEPTWFAVIENELTSLGFISGGAWRLVRQRHGGAAALADLIEREIALGEGEPHCERIVLVTDQPARVEAGRFRVRDLTFAAGAERALRSYAMAVA